MNKINNRNKREENVDNKTGKVFEVDLWARCWMSWWSCFIKLKLFQTFIIRNIQHTNNISLAMSNIQQIPGTKSNV